MVLLKDKVALVSGAGSGIGRAIAVAYAKEGAKVVVAGINEEHAIEKEKSSFTTGSYIITDGGYTAI